MKRKKQPREQKYGCGWCSESYTASAIAERVVSATTSMKEGKVFVVWTCRKGHEAYSVIPLDKF